MLPSFMIVLATFYLTTAAPYAALTSTDDHNMADNPKIVLSLASDEIEGAETEDGGVDTAESPPDEDIELNDNLLQQREARTKNFLRFGRSDGGSPTKDTNNKGNNARFSRGDLDDNFIRLGRANFMRLGRADPEGGAAKNLVARGANSNFIRLGRTKTEPSNFIRFGRGNSGFIRFGRNGGNEGTEEYVTENIRSNGTLARLARASTLDSNFIRFGRQQLSDRNFMRLGRSDNFLRFGKGENYLRFGRGSADNFIRFGRGKNTESLFGRGKLSDRNFIRLGRSGQQSITDDRDSDIGMGQIPDSEKPTLKSSSQYIRFGKRVPNIPELNTNFMRFGRDIERIEATPQERYSSNNRSKRSIDSDDDIVRSDLYDDYQEQPDSSELPLRYYSPIIGVPFAPELTVLPSFHPKRTLGGGNDNFIRFG